MPIFNSKRNLLRTALPEGYAADFAANDLKIASLHDKIRRSASSSSSGGEADRQQEALASAVISKSFMEWVVKTGRAGQILDLVKLDRAREDQNNGR